MSYRFLVLAALALVLGLAIAPSKASAQLVITPSADRLPAVSGPGVQQPQIPTQPLVQLRIDAIRAIAVDRAGRLMATLDIGRSVQIWEIQSGRMVSVIRPPQGEGRLGEMTSIALSPDGKLLAVGWRSETTASLMLFDTSSGTMKRRMDGVSDVVTDIRFSPDGGRIAVMSISGGLALFDALRGVQVARAETCSANAYSVDFSPDGTRLLTTCLNGSLNLYSIAGSSIKLLKSVDATYINAKPTNARFSPGGSMIVVTFSLAGIQVRDAETLLQQQVLKRTILGSNMPETAWSPDERFLWAYDVKWPGESRIWRWDAFPPGHPQLPFNALSPFTPYSFTENGMVSAVRALPDGGVVFITRQPAWGTLSATGQVQWKWIGQPLRFGSYGINTAKPLKILLSADARRVGFNYSGHDDPAVFDLGARAITSPQAGLVAARTSAPGIKLKLTGVMGLSTSTKVAELNGRPLPLDPREMATSAAISPAGDTFALGTVTNIRMFSKTGALLWRQPGIVFGVNISGDGKWVVTDNADGTIRWFRASDGQPAMTFYPHPDRKRWVMWTPSGYFDASEGGDDLLGWLMNRGPNQAADFFPASRFADTMRRPDLLARVLQAGGEDQALALANAASGRGDAKVTPAVIAASLPPVIDLVSAPTVFSGATVNVQIRIRTAKDAPVIGAPRVKINGRWQPPSRAAGQVAADGSRTLVIGPLDPKDAAIEIYADNRAGPSTPAAFSLKWGGGRAGGSQGAPVRKPRLFLLAIGVSQYQQPNLTLQFADNDAKLFAAALKAQEGKLYSQVVVKLLVNGAANQKDVQAGLAWLQSQVAANDVGILYLAGHGFQTPDQNYFFAPADFDPQRPRQTGVDYRLIRDTLARFNAGGNRALFVVDTCHSGSVLGNGLGSSNAGELASTLSRPEYGVVVLTASKGSQLSFEDAQWRGGAFTRAILEGIVDARADSAQTGEVTVFGLGAYVMARVPVLTERRQSPMFLTSPGGSDDFALAVH